MRLSKDQADEIFKLKRKLAGHRARIRLFGSRVDDQARGGDLDLLLQLPDPVDNPALMAAKLSASISRIFAGRHVEVVVMAPNLRRLPIHDIAQREGVLL